MLNILLFIIYMSKVVIKMLNHVSENSPTLKDPSLLEEENRGSFLKDPAEIHAVALPLIREMGTTKPPARSSICEVIDVKGDLYGMSQNVSNVWHRVYGQTPPGQVNGLALFSVYGLYTGYVRGKQGVQGYIQSTKIGDHTGQAVGALNGIRGPVEIMRGCSNTLMGALSIAAAYSVKGATTGSTVLNGINYAFSGIIYVLLAIPNVMYLVKNVRFGQLLNRAMDRESGPVHQTIAALRLLIDSLEGSEEEKEECIKKVVEDPKVWDEKGEAVLDLNEWDDSRELSEKEKTFLLKNATEYTSNRECAQRLYGHFQKAYCAFKQKKEAEFVRKTGLRSLEAVRHICTSDSFLADIENGNRIEKGKEVIACVKREMTKNKIIYLATIVFCSLGVGILLASTLGVTGIGIPIAWVILSLGMFAIDWYVLSEKLQLEKRDKGDQISLLVANALIALTIGVGMSVGGGFAPFIIEGFWIAGLCIYSLSHLKTKRHKEDTVPLILSKKTV